MNPNRFAAVPEELYLLKLAVVINIPPVTLLNAGRILRLVWEGQEVKWRGTPYPQGDTYHIYFSAPRSEFLFVRNGVFHHALVQRNIPVGAFMSRASAANAIVPKFIDPGRCMAAIHYANAYDQAVQLAGEEKPAVANLDWSYGPHDWAWSWLPVTYPSWLEVLETATAALKRASPKLHEREGNPTHVQAVRVLNTLDITVPMGNGSDGPAIRIHWNSPRVTDRQRFLRWFQNSAKGLDVKDEIEALLFADTTCKAFMERLHQNPPAPLLEPNPVLADPTRLIRFATLQTKSEPKIRKRDLIDEAKAAKAERKRKRRKVQGSDEEGIAGMETVVALSDGLEGGADDISMLSDFGDVSSGEAVDFEMLDTSDGCDSADSFSLSHRATE